MVFHVGIACLLLVDVAGGLRSELEIEGDLARYEPAVGDNVEIDRELTPEQATNLCPGNLKTDEFQKKDEQDLLASISTDNEGCREAKVIMISTDSEECLTQIDFGRECNENMFPEWKREVGPWVPKAALKFKSKGTVAAQKPAEMAQPIATGPKPTIEDCSKRVAEWLFSALTGPQQQEDKMYTVAELFVAKNKARKSPEKDICNPNYVMNRFINGKILGKEGEMTKAVSAVYWDSNDLMDYRWCYTDENGQKMSELDGRLEEIGKKLIDGWKNDGTGKCGGKFDNAVGTPTATQCAERIFGIVDEFFNGKELNNQPKHTIRETTGHAGYTSALGYNVHPAVCNVGYPLAEIGHALPYDKKRQNNLFPELRMWAGAGMVGAAWSKCTDESEGGLSMPSAELARQMLRQEDYCPKSATAKQCAETMLFGVEQGQGDRIRSTTTDGSEDPRFLVRQVMKANKCAGAEELARKSVQEVITSNLDGHIWPELDDGSASRDKTYFTLTKQTAGKKVTLEQQLTTDKKQEKPVDYAACKGAVRANQAQMLIEIGKTLKASLFATGMSEKDIEVECAPAPIEK